MKQSIASTIQLLPEHIIDQIKAGEVIERPSTLIKEILENAIDAGSTKISLHLIDNGLELIALEDNGKGILASDLPLAFCRHATSKINRFEDIYHLDSYGFRGEALASIASISKITCESKTSKTSGLIKIEGGHTLLHEDISEQNTKTGTKFFIKDLFFNTPVRMKFIQSKTSEKNQLVKIIRSFLLANPQIEFSIKWDQNEKEIYQIKMLQERISDVLFKKRKSHFMHTQTQYDGVSFEIFLSQESSRGNAHKYHFLFINNRYIHDIQIHKIILNSAKHLWPELESGHYIAKLHIPSDEIDVNVHPNKIVVKLFQAPKIYSLISGTIKNKILSPLQTRSSHKEPLINKKIEEQNLFPTSDSMIPTFKDIDYKKIDFEQESEVTNYLEHIHNKDQMFNGPTTQSYSHFKDFVIIVENSQVFLLNKSELIMSHLYKILTSSVEENEVIPLLVSRPLSLKKKLNVKQEIFIRSLGFDIDFLEEKTLVVRSFPKKLQSLPYLSLLDFIISTRSTNLKAISFKEYPLDEISNSLIENIYQKLTASEKNKKIVFPIEENDLKKLYEQKK